MTGGVKVSGRDIHRDRGWFISTDQRPSRSARSISAPCTFVISTRPRNETWPITLALTNCRRDSQLSIQIAIFFFSSNFLTRLGKKILRNILRIRDVDREIRSRMKNLMKKWKGIEGKENKIEEWKNGESDINMQRYEKNSRRGSDIFRFSIYTRQVYRNRYTAFRMKSSFKHDR